MSGWLKAQSHSKTILSSGGVVQMKSSRFPSNIENPDYCFDRSPRGTMPFAEGSGASTVPENFDAFGEVLPARGVNDADASRTPSAVLRQIGQVIFWALVVAIVLARIFYFTDPVFQPGNAQTTKTEAAR
jgi:hypothetical protein